MSNNPTKFIDYMYVINEMMTNISKSLDNLSSVIAGQYELIKCLTKENNPKFAGFITQLKKTTNDYQEQLRILTYRLQKFDELKELATSNENKYITTLLLEAFGIANKDAKTLEERLQNKEDSLELVK